LAHSVCHTRQKIVNLSGKKEEVISGGGNWIKMSISQRVKKESEYTKKPRQKV